jgi:hypothetical protein
MKATLFTKVSVILFATVFTSICNAADFYATNSGNWSNPTIWTNSTGTNGTVLPGPDDTVDVPPGTTVTLDTNATVAYVYDSGTLTMGPNTTLILLQDPMIAPALTFNATALSNTVVYTGNPYNARVVDYYNLMLANTNWTPVPPFQLFEDFNNFSSASVSTATPMTVYGNMSVLGFIKVQEANVPGVPITIHGDLTIGQGCRWDCSSGNLTVMGNAYIYGLLEDLDGANGTNYINGNIIVAGPRVSGKDVLGNYTNGWYLGDVITWGLGGSLTNNGAIYGIGYGSIFFDGTGSIAGSNILTLPTMTINGTYAIDTTIRLTTNNADFKGTLIFDLANTNQIDLIASGASTNNTHTNYYHGNLIVTNSGAAPTAGKTYKLFDAENYTGSFSSQTLPSLPAGLNWVDNLLTTGSLVVGSSGVVRPALAWSRTGNQLTLSWDSATFPGFSVVAQTNQNGLGSNWSPISGGTTSPFTVTINPTNPAVFFRLFHP